MGTTVAVRGGQRIVCLEEAKTAANTEAQNSPERLNDIKKTTVKQKAITIIVQNGSRISNSKHFTDKENYFYLLLLFLTLKIFCRCLGRFKSIRNLIFLQSCC